MDFGLCAPTRFIFFDIDQSLLVDFGLCASTRLVFFLILVTHFCRLSRVIQPTTGWGYTFFRTVAAKKLVGLCKQHCFDAVYLGFFRTAAATAAAKATAVAAAVRKKPNPNLLSVVLP